LKRISCITVFLLGLFVLSWSPAPAQVNTKSPYSRYGIGELAGKGFERNRAMGGIGLALRDNNHINYLNPASYTAQDTLSFLFNFGLKSAFRTYKTNSNTSNSRNFRMDHLAIAFPITKWWKTSFGVLPFSSVGYSIVEKDFLENNDPVDYIFEGNGGFNQLYLGTSFKIFKGLNIGANFTYLFGSMDISKQLEFPLNDDYSIITMENRTIINDFIYHFGIQYQHTFADHYTFTIGGIYDLSTKIKAENRVTISNLFEGSKEQINDTLVLIPQFIIDYSNSYGSIEMPYQLGGGLSFHYNNRFTVGFDYYEQDWTNASFFNKNEPLGKNNSAHFGLEIIPDPTALSGYYNRISYRAGVHYENMYLKLKDEQLKDYGISFGVGLPLRGALSSCNIACEIGQRGTLENNLIKENYVFLSFNVTLHDFWFIKRKYD
jgi:hypothetical protein